MWILASKLIYLKVYVRVGVNRGQRTLKGTLGDGWVTEHVYLKVEWGARRWRSKTMYENS